MDKSRIKTIAGIFACLLPLLLHVFGLAAITRLHDFVCRDASDSGIIPHHDFWGGNPNEIFSHWLDMFFMSGNALAIAWLLMVESLAGTRLLALLARVSAPVIVLVTGLGVIGLDGERGEGTVPIACLIYFLPLLISSTYLLRRLAALVHWRPPAVGLLATIFFAAHLGAQLQYEPSGTGAPNELIFSVWLFCVGGALAWWFVRLQTRIRAPRPSPDPN